VCVLCVCVCVCVCMCVCVCVCVCLLCSLLPTVCSLYSTICSLLSAVVLSALVSPTLKYILHKHLHTQSCLNLPLRQLHLHPNLLWHSPLPRHRALGAHTGTPVTFMQHAITLVNLTEPTNAARLSEACAAAFHAPAPPRRVVIITHYTAPLQPPAYQN
jgi:hypothetical protein